MGLPIIPLPSSSVEVNGSPVTFRSLSRIEVLKLKELSGDLEEQDIAVIMYATDSTREEVQAFRASTMVMEVGKLTDAILVFSGVATSDDANGDPIDPKSATNGHSQTADLTLTRS